MKIQTILTCALAAAVIAPVALAQQGAPKAGTAPKAAAPKAGVAAPKADGTASPPVTHGPPLTGVCVYSKENLAADSQLGKFVDQRLQQIQASAAATVNQANATLDANTRNARAQLEAMPVDQRNTPAGQAIVTDIQRQAQDFVNLKNDLEQRFEVTVQAALARIEREGGAFLQQIYEQHRCSILFNTEGLIAFNPAMDLTPEVVRLVDGKTTSFEFDLVSAEALRNASNSGTAGAAAAAPAAAAPAPTPGAPSRGPSGPPRAP